MGSERFTRLVKYWSRPSYAGIMLPGNPLMTCDEAAQEITTLRKELAEARNKALEDAALYHDDLAAQHDELGGDTPFHIMMAGKHRRVSRAIRNLKDTTNDHA